jgi:F-type H+-transporting ATPase subunit b
MRALFLALFLTFSGASLAEDGEHAEHHATLTDDDDRDGTPNWRDRDSESFALVRLGSQSFALLVVVGIAIAFGRRPISDFLGDRAIAARRTLSDSAKARTEAELRAASLGDRLSKIEAEILRIRADAEVEAQAEERKLVERAHEESKRIEIVAERKIRDEVQRAQVALRSEAVELAVKLAEASLRGSVSTADQQRLAREFLESLKNDGVNGHG